ncbi:hypothetical protein LMG19087_02900 [Ralstonia wenshanensis]|nr:hypothetical protein LMG19087_02900 [Ralstonia wenshanensis]
MKCLIRYSSGRRCVVANRTKAGLRFFLVFSPEGSLIGAFRDLINAETLATQFWASSIGAQ